MAVTQKQIDALRTADAELSKRLTAEINNRAAADTSLATRLDTVEAAVKAILAAGGSGGGTTPVPNDPPPPPPPDVTAPTISGIAISNVTTTGFTVSWTTSEAATGYVEYGTGTGYGSQTAATASGTAHSRAISGLVPGTTYHFRVRATDTAGNGPTLSSDRTVTTSFVSGGGTPYVSVASISALKAALKINANVEIVMAAGTYAAAPANLNQSNSLWIATPEMAARTNPVLIRADGSGVTLDGNGAKYFGAITFDRGVHHQTWDGRWVLANGEATATGTIVFGSPNAPNLAAGVHHISLTGDWVFDDSLTGYAFDPARSNANDHAIYFTDSLGGCHDILLDGMSLTPNASAPLHSWLHLFTHGYPGGAGAYNVTAKNADITGTRQQVMIWDASMHDLLLEDVSLHDGIRFAIRHEKGTAVTLRRIQSEGTVEAGLVAAVGTSRTLDGCAYVAGEFVLT